MKSKHNARPAKTATASVKAGRAEPAREIEAVDASIEKSEVVRQRILDATLACYVSHGWSGTNMSVISRHLGMTRGMIQYYFPTLDDLLRASVKHLNAEWRKRYFGYIAQYDASSDGRSRDRLEVGIQALWLLMRDPLHTARQELAAAARSNVDLRQVLEVEAGFDEAATLELAKQAYPDLVQRDDRGFRRALDFTVVFLEGLSRHPFSSDAEARIQELLGMLKGYLADYWRSQGVVLDRSARAVAKAPLTAAAPPVAVAADARAGDRERALSLILKAAAILSPYADDASP